jgi:hypothetical protein
MLSASLTRSSRSAELALSEIGTTYSLSGLICVVHLHRSSAFSADSILLYSEPHKAPDCAMYIIITTCLISAVRWEELGTYEPPVDPSLV